MKLTGVARVTREIELRNTPSGTRVGNFSVAFNYGMKDKATGYKPSQFVECALWGEQADRMADYIQPGAVFDLTLNDVHVELYQGKNGPGAKLVGKIIAIDFAPESKVAQPSDSRPAQQQRQTAPASAPAAQESFDDDIPF